MHSTPNPPSVRFPGPLAPFAPGLVDEFARLGYPASTATAKMQFAAHLSRWLAERGLGPAELTGPVVDRFLISRRAGSSCYVGVDAAPDPGVSAAHGRGAAVRGGAAAGVAGRGVAGTVRRLSDRRTRV